MLPIWQGSSRIRPLHRLLDSNGHSKIYNPNCKILMRQRSGLERGTDIRKIAEIVEIVGLKVSNSSAKTQKENDVAPRLTLSLPTLLLCEAGQEH